jgi:hypothetical protein
MHTTKTNCGTMLHVKDIFISSSRFTLSNMAMTPNKCYCIVAFEWMLERCTPLRLTARPSILKPKSAFHHMKMGYKTNIVDNVNAFLFTIWLDKPKGIHLEEHEACNNELFTTSYEIHA